GGVPRRRFRGRRWVSRGPLRGGGGDQTGPLPPEFWPMAVVPPRRSARLARRHLSAPFAWCSRSPLPPLAWVFLLWFVLVVPAIGIRGVHYEEGTTVGLARGAFEDGHSLTPVLFGVRFPARPGLFSSFVA